jgi:hypothetical protein
LSCLPISNEAVMYVVEHCPRLHFIDLRGAFFSLITSRCDATLFFG